MRMLKSDLIVFNVNPNHANDGKFASGGGGGSSVSVKKKPKRVERSAQRRVAGGFLHGAAGYLGGGMVGGLGGYAVGSALGGRAGAQILGQAGAGIGALYGGVSGAVHGARKYKNNAGMSMNDDMYGSSEMAPESFTDRMKRKGTGALKAVGKGALLGGIGGAAGAYGMYKFLKNSERNRFVNSRVRMLITD